MYSYDGDDIFNEPKLIIPQWFRQSEQFNVTFYEGVEWGISVMDDEDRDRRWGEGAARGRVKGGDSSGGGRRKG